MIGIFTPEWWDIIPIENIVKPLNRKRQELVSSLEIRIKEPIVSAGCGHSTVFHGVASDDKRRLWLAIAFNTAMFVIEMTAGLLARSRRKRMCGSVDQTS
jgi:hypothetical protein